VLQLPAAAIGRKVRRMWTAEDRPCPLCGSSDREVLGRRGGAAHHAGLGEETRVVRCRTCDALYAWPTMVPTGNPYSAQADGYFGAHDGTAKTRSGACLADYAASVLGRAGTMLELGCGRGELLAGAASRGWTVSGVEMTPEFAARARDAGVEVEEATIEACQSLSRTYDVILAAAVLEHLYEPAAVLRRIFAAVRPGGLLFIDVPNERGLALRVGNLYQRLQGRDWSINLSPTFPPFHVVGFGPRSLTSVLHAAGFQVHEMRVVKYTNSVLPAPGLKRVVERAAMGAFQRIGHAVGMGDGLVCWARRP
jgi:SAM-dependent methyltransferase